MKKPTFTRYRRVLDVLQADNLLKRKLSPPDVAVCRPDQSHDLFPAEVVYLTDELHKAGYDTFTLTKNEIVQYGHQFLVQNELPKNVATTKPKVMPSPSIRKPLADELVDRIQFLNQTIDTYRSELDDCKTALKALRAKQEPPEPPEPPKPEPPPPPAPRVRGVKAFQEKVLAMLNDPSSHKNDEGKLTVHVEDVIKAWKKVTDEEVCYSTCHSRLYRMAKDYGLIEFKEGWATLP